VRLASSSPCLLVIDAIWAGKHRRYTVKLAQEILVCVSRWLCAGGCHGCVDCIILTMPQQDAQASRARGACKQRERAMVESSQFLGARCAIGTLVQGQLHGGMSDPPRQLRLSRLARLLLLPTLSAVATSSPAPSSLVSASVAQAWCRGGFAKRNPTE
jgi:hypothetical protein